MSREVVVLSGVRTAVGGYGGSLKDIPPSELAARCAVVFDTDETVRPGTTVEKLAKLRPAFDQEGTVTPGNASSINDAASAVVLMERE